MTEDERPQWNWNGHGYSAPHADHWESEAWVYIRDRERHLIALEPDEMTDMCRAWVAWLQDLDAIPILNDLMERFQLHG